MSDIAISVQDLWKQFRLGKVKSTSFRESVGQWFTKSEVEYFWALKELDFEVKRGEAVGIIGKNGAGKSTLLKVLSKITYPTKGRVEINGRVSSLLEVGTGFHPELSGRENVFLNGTILGMTRSEIKAKFDEVVAFSGVEKFINTPVKHYSSGMKVRLAFSVAAHLEPEILMIDEVLAVGDSTFQKKCTDKMTAVVKEGRTVLFVSHNLQALQNICSKGILIKAGMVEESGQINSILKKYLLGTKSEQSQNQDLRNSENRRGSGQLIFQEIQLNTINLSCGDKLTIQLKLKSKAVRNFDDLLLGINIKDLYEVNIIHLSNIFLDKINISHEKDDQIYQFEIPFLNLKSGQYIIGIFLRSNEEIQDWIEDAIRFEILEGNVYNFSNSKMITGMIQPIFNFEVLEK